MSTFEELPTRDHGRKPPLWTYQVYGVDVLLDEKLNPYLLEINTNPGFVGRAGKLPLFCMSDANANRKCHC